MISKTISSVLILCAISTVCNAQSTATAGSEASMIIPLSIVKTVDMQYGVLAASATAGEVALYTDDSRITSGGVTITPNSSAAAAAQFLITGEPDHLYGYDNPNAFIVTGPGGATMNLEALDVSADGTLDAFGNSTLKISYTLYVGANQPAGVYTNASDLYITVTYY